MVCCVHQFVFGSPLFRRPSGNEAGGLNKGPEALPHGVLWVHYAKAGELVY